ncbi:MAG: hypothetical protein OEU76_05210 [Cyclobacteriaceae bacterium]|nr:hypothetical protein [Cyclobacteriaceae bacterium]
MKYLLFLLAVILFACQGKLTDEQKKEMREGMEASRIKKISEAEIIDAAFLWGRDIVRQLDNKYDTQSMRSLEDALHVRIYPLQTGDSVLREIEQQLIEAYTSTENVSLADNVQKISDDSLLYTFPVMDTLPDRSVAFRFALGILMPKKEVILSMDE